MQKVSPLVAFVHVPKTAGSTVNAHLLQSGRPGQDHIEVWRSKPELVRQQLKKLDWVSGHVNFPEMRSMLCAGTARRIDFFTVLRDPLRQLASHYNWLIEIRHRGEEFYNNHPPIIKEISERINKADNSSPREIIAQLEAARGLFLNQQSRTVLGEGLGDMSTADLEARLSVFNFIATEFTLSALLSRLVETRIETVKRENASIYHFDPVVFQSPELIEFLRDKHAADFALVAHVNSLKPSLDFSQVGSTAIPDRVKAIVRRMRYTVKAKM